MYCPNALPSHLKCLMNAEYMINSGAIASKFTLMILINFTYLPERWESSAGVKE
jgi:hypothetical protein